MIDIVRGAGAGFINMAERLGYSDLITFQDGKLSWGLNKKYTLFGMDTDVRKAVEKTKPDFIFDQEIEKRADYMHQRNSGLNHIICQLAAKNDVAVAFSFVQLLDLRTRSKAMGRMAQNIKLCRKYKVRMIIASFAQEPYQMRAPKDLISLFVKIGMHPKEAKDALSEAQRIIERKKKVMVADGVEVI